VGQLGYQEHPCICVRRKAGLEFTTIDAIHDYLLIFHQPDDTRADDFEMTAKAPLKAYEAQDVLRGGVSCANGVHSWQGRMAYDLLAAMTPFNYTCNL
jgi:hypothetical protein